MGTVIELAAFRRAKAIPRKAAYAVRPPSEPSTKPHPPTKSLSPDDRWNALTRPVAFKPGAPIDSRKKQEVLQLLEFEFSTNIVVDDDGREYLWYPDEHEKARAYFRLFGFDIDTLSDADAMYALWLRLSACALYVKKYLENHQWFCESMTADMPAAWFRYVKAIARRDYGQTARLSYILDLDPFTRPTQDH
ncbi:hypothetical protein [Trinickia mobilis]|uniref:hypothetical protein n=1 Tax=Trinickia mobilis TaxID=2816356 RepID=UPI001A8E1C7B|nr:hypothetical protein [Trinickia mobilis]